jgi:sec-independent protein translocase protein TatC
MSNTTTEQETPPESTEPENESGKMSFLEHLDELRKRLVHIVAYLFGGFLICLYFCRQIYDFLSVPFTKSAPEGTKLVFTTLTAPFSVYMKVAFLAGIFVTIPGTLYEVWKFIAPGLYKKEKRYVIPFLVSSILLFVMGGAFCYLYIMPQAYGWLINLGSSFTPMIDIQKYFDLTNMMILGFGLIFEMPVIIGFLSLFGLVSPAFLLRHFKYAVLIMVILAAALSPTGDALNLIIWSAPMVLLYIISIGVAYILNKLRKKKNSV